MTEKTASLSVDVWQRLEDFAGAARMPADATVRGAHVHFPILGRGGYGFVALTQDPSVVVKLTEDPDEALFMAYTTTLAHAAERAPGVVYAHAVLQVRRQSARGESSRWAIWRDAVTDPGYPAPSSMLAQRLAEIADVADEVYEVFELLLSTSCGQYITREKQVRWWQDVVLPEVPSHYGKHPAGTRANVKATAAARVAEGVEAYEQLLFDLESVPGGQELAPSLLYYLSMGVMFADTRGHNIGRRLDTGTPILFDPGLAIVVQPGVLDAVAAAMA